MLTLQNVLESRVIESLGWALVHFVWHGSVLALLLKFAMVVLERAPAQTRYVVQCATLLAMVLCSVGTWWWIAATERPPEVVAPAAVDAGLQQIPITDGPRMADSVAFGPMGPTQDETVESVVVEPATTELILPIVSTERLLTANRMSWEQQIHGSLLHALPWLVSAWLAGVLMLSLRLLVGWRIVQRMKQLGVTPAAEGLQDRLKILAVQLGITHTVKLVESVLVEVPAVIGWIHPVILLPLALFTNLTPQQLDAVLAHELAHIRRHDYLVNLIQTAIETLLFYHPAVWWLSRLIRAEREHCCDDMALRLCDTPMTYVSALAMMEELRASPAMTLAVNGGSLLHRVRRIALGPAADSRQSSQWGASLITLATVLVLGFTTYLNSQPYENTSGVEGELQQPMRESTGSTVEVLKSDEQSAPTSGIRISGRVLDAETGKVIDRIRVIPAPVYQDDSKNLTWQTHYLKDFADGRFVYETDRPWDKTRLRIEADGYQPVMTRVVKKGESVETDVKLERRILRGVVLLPDDTPVSKAQVVLATWTNEINISERKVSYSHHGALLRKVVETDELGRFVLPAEVDPAVLVVAHANGYAEQSNAETSLARKSADVDDGSDVNRGNPVIYLQPWGRVEGRVLKGDKGVVGAKYLIYPSRIDDVHVHLSGDVVTDENGRFSVADFPPCRYGVCQRAVESDDGKLVSSLGGLRTNFVVSPGKTTILELGDPGRTVTGRLVLPEGFPYKIDWSHVAMDVSPSAPSFKHGLSGPWSKFLDSDEGKSYVRKHITISENGSFRIEGLPAAEYRFSVKASGEAAISENRPAGPLFSGAGSFAVTGVVSQEPVEEIDLGVIDLQSHVPLKKVADLGRGEAAKNGLRARVIPVLSSMSEDNIDPTQRVTKFAKPDDAAFVIEIENVSDKPIHVLDTRYGDSYGEARGKGNSKWFAQFLFSFDLFDQNGKRIERPEVQVVSQDMVLDGTLVMPLAPGAIHRFLLKPAEWLRPFTLSLEHGRYGIVVRYHGMPDRVATRIKEYRPDSPTLQAVAGDVVTGVVQIDVASEKKTGSEVLKEETTEIDGGKNKGLLSQLVWGIPSNGLRAAMSFAPQKSTHAHGDKPKLNLHVQNVSDKPIIFATALWLSELNASMKDHEGKPVAVDAVWYSGMTPVARVTLKPQQILNLDAGNIGFAISKERAEKFEHVTNRTLVAPAGKYSLQLGGRFGDSFLLKDGKDKVLAPLEGDYIGELKTGVTPFEVTNETIDCEIVDAVTSNPVAGTTVNFRFFKPKAGEKPEEIVSDMFWGPKSPSRIYFMIPEEVLKRTDREDFEVEWRVSGHPDYELLAPAERIKLMPFFRDGTKAIREKLKQIKLTPKKALNAVPGLGTRTAAARYRGTVSGVDGRPFKGACIYLLPFSLKARSIGAVRAESDADGQFEFDAPDMTYVDDRGQVQRKQGLVIASAEGFASDWSRTVGQRHGGFQTIPPKETSIELRLAKDDVPIHGRFLGPDGRPLERARVQVVEVMIPLQQDLDVHLDWEVKASHFNSIAYARSFYQPLLLPGLKAEARTDRNGQFTLSGIGRDRLVRLMVSGPTIVDTELEVMTRESPDVRTRLGDSISQTEILSMIHGAGFTLGVKPGRTIKGQVIDHETGKPIAGMWVGPRQNAVTEITPSVYPWTTDEAGRFTVSGISPSRHDVEIAAVTTPGLPYQSASAMAVGQDEITIRCQRGIPFLLKVVDQHNRPVTAEVWYTDIQPNPHIAKQRDEFRWPVNTAANLGGGNYRGFVLPGPGAVLVRLSQEIRYRPARVNPKAFFAPGSLTSDTSQFGTLNELVISRGVYRDTIYRDDRIAQKDFASIVLVNPPIDSNQLELVATVTIDPEPGPSLR